MRAHPPQPLPLAVGRVRGHTRMRRSGWAAGGRRGPAKPSPLRPGAEPRPSQRALGRWSSVGRKWEPASFCCNLKEGRGQPNTSPSAREPPVPEDTATLSQITAAARKTGEAAKGVVRLGGEGRGGQGGGSTIIFTPNKEGMGGDRLDGQWGSS